jgi:hypothetical protein
MCGAQTPSGNQQEIDRVKMTSSVMAASCGPPPRSKMIIVYNVPRKSPSQSPVSLDYVLVSFGMRGSRRIRFN